MFNIIEIVKCEKEINWHEVSKLKKCYFHHLKHELVKAYERLVFIRNGYLSDIEDSVRFCRKRDIEIEKDLVQTIHDFENVYVKYFSFITYLKGGKLICH